MNKQDVHLYVFDGLSDWEASYAIAARVKGVVT